MTTLESSTAAPADRRRNTLVWLSRYGTLAAFLALIVFNIAVTPNFLSWQTLNVNLTQVATIVIVAVGMTLVIATGGIDLSVGSLMAISGALAPMIFLGTIVPIENPVLAITLAFTLPVIAAALCGWFNGMLITRYSIQPIVATLVLFIAGRGIAQVMTNGNLQVFKNGPFQFIALGRIFGIPAQVVIMIIVVAAAAFLIRRTGLGRQIIAVGGNEKAARLAGIPAKRVKQLVYVISGALAGIAGLIVVARNSASDANLVGLGMELDAIAAVAVGGTLLTGGRANVLGTLLGACVIQLVRYTLLANGVPDAAALVVKAGLIVAAVYIQQRADETMSSASSRLAFLGPLAPKSNIDLARLGVVAALLALILFGALRYDNFISQYNALSFLRYNSMFALIALGMALVIMTGGIDLSVGGTAAMSSVVAALLSPYHWAAGLAGGLAAGLAVGLINGLVITKLRIQPFIATLAAMLAAYGTGLLLAGNQSVSVSYDSGFTIIGQDDFLGFPIPAWIAILFYIAGWVALERHAVGRRILAIGDGEATAKLMGLKVERTLMGVYMTSGLCAGMAGVILASQFGAGQPTEGVGWELFAIASVVVGGTLLTGGVGSVGATLAGALLLAMVFNILNFENGLGWISLSAYWQSVIRGLFLLAVVVLQAKLAGNRETV